MERGSDFSGVPFEELLIAVLVGDGRLCSALRDQVTRLGGVMQAELIAAELDRARGTAGDEEEERMRQRIAELYRRVASHLRRHPPESAGRPPGGRDPGGRDPLRPDAAPAQAAPPAPAPAPPAPPAPAVLPAPASDLGARDREGAGAAGVAGGTRSSTVPRAGGGAWAGEPRPAVQETGEQIRRAMEQVFADFAEAAEVRAWTGDQNPVEAGDLADRWTAFHLCLLRLPAEVESRWRRRMAAAAPAAWQQPGEAWQRIPTPRALGGRILVPACGPRAGVLADPSAAYEEGVARRPPSPTSALAAALAGQMAWLARTDPAAFSARTARLVPLRERDELTAYDALLAERSAKFAEAIDGNYRDHCVVRAAQLAEGLRLVVHRPLVAPDSWWGRARAEALSLVGRVRHEHAPHVQVVEIAGRYAEVSRDGLTVGREDVRLQVRPGDDGQVLDCLRPYLRSPDIDEKPGRVVYGAIR